MLIVFRESLAQFQTMIMLIFILVWGLLSGLVASSVSVDINAKFSYLTLDPNATITKVR